MELDLSYVQALPVLPLQSECIRLIMVGLGGTGSFLARHVACIVSLLHGAGKNVSLILIDPDSVEASNIPRQNFCAAEIGRYKVEALAERYSRAFGIEIACLPISFVPDVVRMEWNTLTVLIGAVDNAAARVALESVLATNEIRSSPDRIAVPQIWWLDLGNGLDYGQILFGSTTQMKPLAATFTLSALPRCSMLPSPLLQEPMLRQPRPEEQIDHRLSCAELLAANVQAMTINPVMAVEGADYLYRFLMTGTLKKFATYLDLPAGTKRSSYITPQTLAKVLGCQPSFFLTRENSQD